MRAWTAELASTHFHLGKESALWRFHFKEQLCDLPGTVHTERRCQQGAAMAAWPVPDDGTIECWQINLREARRSQTDSGVLLAVSLGSFEYVELSTCNPAQWRRDPREPGKLTYTVRINTGENQLSDVSAHPFLLFSLSLLSLPAQ